MFGYVTADLSLLDEEQRQRYQGFYCGLCHALGRVGSPFCRLAVNFDMVFLILLLSSLYDGEEASGPARCAAHPFRKRLCFQTRWTGYGAAMSVLLLYHKCLDDWHDDHDLLRLGGSRLFRGSSRRFSKAWPRQAGTVADCLDRLSELESRGVPEPDRAANLFARLLGELFVPDIRDRWADDLRAVGEGLGRFIYLADAAADIREDLRRKRYNPLAGLAPRGILPETFRQDLTVLLGEAADAFERLPLVDDVGLLRNILYAGVWQRLDRAAQDKAQKTETRGPRWEGGPL